jgi:IS1 family transposase
MAVLAAPFKSKSRLEAENAALRHQLIVLRRKMLPFLKFARIQLICNGSFWQILHPSH